MSSLSVEGKNRDKRQSSTFRGSYTLLVDWTRRRLFAETNLNHLLDIAQFYGELRWKNCDGAFHDIDVEEFVEKQIMQSKSFNPPILSGTFEGTVLIASVLQDTGGHSRVVLNWMRAFKEKQEHRLLVTRELANAFMKTLDNQGIPYHLCSNRGIDLINEILAFCANSARIVLHINPDDIVTATAARILARSGKQVLFYNHADHVFSFGISSAQLVCEISSYGMELNRRTQRAKDSYYLGIPIDFDGQQDKAATSVESKHGKVVLSIGASYKYAPAAISFGDFVDLLLQRRSDVTFQFVGPTGNEPWWVGVKERWGPRIQFLGTLSYHQCQDIMKSADVLVDSYPICGGTVFPDALLNGKLVAGLSNPIQGYSPADELRVADVRCLTEEVNNLLDGDLTCLERIERIREKAADIHSIAKFRQRVTDLYIGSHVKHSKARVTIETHWFENKWERERDISLPSSAVWYTLPWSFCIAFSFAFNRILGSAANEHMNFLMSRIAVNVLPDILISYGRHLRDNVQTLHLR